MRGVQGSLPGTAAPPVSVRIEKPEGDSVELHLPQLVGKVEEAAAEVMREGWPPGKRVPIGMTEELRLVKVEARRRRHRRSGERKVFVIFTAVNDYPSRACDCVIFALRNHLGGGLKKLVHFEFRCRAPHGAASGGA